MIWIVSVLMILLITYLVLQGISEREKYKSKSSSSLDSEEDMSLFMRINERISPKKYSGNIELSDEDTIFANMVTYVQRKTANASKRLDQKALNARQNIPSDTFFERTVSRIKRQTDTADIKLTNKINEQTAAGDGHSIFEENNFFGQFAAKVNNSLREKEAKFQSQQAHLSNQSHGKLSDEQGFFAGAIRTISSRLESIDARVEKKVTAARENPIDNDIFSRTVQKVSNRINTQ